MASLCIFVGLDRYACLVDAPVSPNMYMQTERDSYIWDWQLLVNFSGGGKVVHIAAMLNFFLFTLRSFYGWEGKLASGVGNLYVSHLLNTSLMYTYSAYANKCKI